MSHVEFQDLVAIMAKLRGPGGCPWDREQTHSSLSGHLIEEAYEVVDSIEQGDDDHLREELGDLLLQIVFHAQIAAERGAFDIDDVAAAIAEKLRRRHPHIYAADPDAESDVTQAADVIRNWEAIKEGEGKYADSRLDGIPRSLPALFRSYKMQKKMADVGFDWPDKAGVVAALETEAEEYRQALRGDGDLREEIGDMLFMLGNVARHHGIEPEAALRAANDKIEGRWRYMEREAAAAGRRLDEMTMDEKESLWQQAKEEESKV